MPDLVDHLLRRPGSTWYAHAGGAYDFLPIAEELRKREIPTSLDLAGSRVSRVVGGGIVLRDSWPLVPLKLEIAASLAGEVAPRLALPCRCGRACGGYCSIRPNDPRAAVAEYCAEDARVLYRVLRAIDEIGESLNLSLRGTLGGTAWATARDRLALPDAKHPPAEWRMIREAYFGGRVSILMPRARGPGSHWDLSSAYPAALARTPVPVGDPTPITGAAARRALGASMPGIYSATVKVPECHIPPLPVRDHVRIIYPHGTFRGVWTARELRAAIDRGTTIEECSWGLMWPREEILFAPVIEQWWRARSRAGKSSALGQWLRLLSNSLTGKFAEGGERRSALMFPAEIRYCQGRRPCSARECTGACGAMTQLDLWGQVWTVPIFRPAPSGHIAWAATLTASTRESLLLGMESQGSDLVYSDTDSIWTIGRTKPTPNGSGLGQWEYKHAWRSWECAAPRAYRYDPQDGERVTRTAGAQITDDEWARGNAEIDRGVLSFVEAASASRGLFRRRKQIWTLPDRGSRTGWYGDRILDAETGITVPVEYGSQNP